MEILKTITDENFDPESTNIKTREAARAVLFNEENKIPVMFVSKHNYHKLPGGGIEAGETALEALPREIMEETGCSTEVTGELGIVIEHRSDRGFDDGWCLSQTSYCYIGKAIPGGKTNYTKEEIDSGFTFVWMTIDEAIRTLENDTPDNKEGRFILERDLTFLKAAKGKINSAE